MAVALWRRLYAPSAMPWANGRIHPSLLECLSVCAACPRLNRLPDIDIIWHDWESLARKTLSIIDVPPSKLGIGRCPNPLCGVELTAAVGAVSVACPVCGSTYRVTDVRLGFLRACVRSGRAFTAGSVRSCCANADSSAARARFAHGASAAGSSRSAKREGAAVVQAFRRAWTGHATRLDLTKSKVQRKIVSGLEGLNHASESRSGPRFISGMVGGAAECTRSLSGRP